MKDVAAKKRKWYSQVFPTASISRIPEDQAVVAAMHTRPDQIIPDQAAMHKRETVQTLPRIHSTSIEARLFKCFFFVKSNLFLMFFYALCSERPIYTDSRSGALGPCTGPVLLLHQTPIMEKSEVDST